MSKLSKAHASTQHHECDLGTGKDAGECPHLNRPRIGYASAAARHCFTTSCPSFRSTSFASLRLASPFASLGCCEAAGSLLAALPSGGAPSKPTAASFAGGNAGQRTFQHLSLPSLLDSSSARACSQSMLITADLFYT